MGIDKHPLTELSRTTTSTSEIIGKTASVFVELLKYTCFLDQSEKLLVIPNVDIKTLVLRSFLQYVSNGPWSVSSSNVVASSLGTVRCQGIVCLRSF